MSAWLGFTALAVLLWGVWGFLAKLATESIDGRTAAALQGIGAAAVTLLLLVALRVRPALPVPGGLAAAGAGAALFLGIIAFVFALARGGQASVVVPMTALYPVVTVVLSVMLLGERLTLAHMLGVAMAVGAVMLLSR